jgi:hypothetical protein
MQDYCTGFTGQVGLSGRAVGGNDSSVGVGPQWPNGGALLYGIPWQDVLQGFYSFLDMGFNDEGPL